VRPSLIAPAESKPELAKYELCEEIGHGGMATVFLAKDRRLGREVALKIIHRHLRENTEVAARFASEARAVAKLKHANIVEVYDVSDEAEPERYLVVEYVRGTTLRALLTAEESLPPEIAAIIGVEVALGLDHAHGQGVIHRDVKPENVLMAAPPSLPVSEHQSNPEEALVKITDFGIAKLLDAQGVTSTGQVLGSPAHMAPEQIEGGDVDARSDVFGLGVLLYESMVGRLPFDGKNPAQVLRRVLDGAFTPPEKARPSVGTQFSVIVSKALAHEQSGRYSSALELANALKDELVALGFTDLRAELRAFLTDRSGYLAAYEPRIVEKLVRRAGDARLLRDIPLSAACLNRALAVRPDDAELLAEVTSLGRAERLRRNLRSGALALGASALLGGFAFAVSSIPLPSLGDGDAPSAAAVSTIRAPTVAPRAPQPNVAASQAARSKPDAPRKPSIKPPRPTETTSDVMAPVRIAVDGPQNATVRVDGAELRDWFGTQSLPVGPHVFEFVPPNSECCEGAHRFAVEIQPPSGGEPQRVRGRIGFKDATLDLRGQPGTRASCGELGEFPVPSRQVFEMTAATRLARCTLIPPLGSGALPKEFDVTLSPGRLSSILGP
jgi:tRNA A-37 threonylcarbamoyl transferase component Bud32